MGKLYMKEKVFSLGGHFTIKDEAEQDKYIVEGSFMKIPKEFTIKNMRGGTIGTVTKKVLTFLPKFFVDIAGADTITISKELTFLKSRYQVSGEGITVQGDLLGRNFAIEKNGHQIAVVEKKWFTWGDTYEIDIVDPAFEHITVAIVIAIDTVKQDEANSSSSGAN